MAEKEKKTTKKEWYAELRNLVEASEHDRKNEMIEFIDNQVAQLDAKIAKAQEKAAEKKAEGDELRETVYAVLNCEYQTIEDITAQVNVDGVTKAKVTSRLSQLVKCGRAEKDMVKTEEGRKVTAYRVATATAPENTVTA